MRIRNGHVFFDQFLFLALLAGSSCLHAAEVPSVSDAINWPPVTQESRPWTYWWWLANAVNPVDLTWNLEQYRQVGMGGVHVIPIFGGELRVPKGCEDQYIDYLSPKWMTMLAHTTREAERLGMGIDMTTGTAWNFGGPHVSARDANYWVIFETYKLRAGTRFDKKLDRDSLQAFLAYSSQGEVVDLIEKIGSDCLLNWEAPEGNWEIYCVSQKLSNRNVKHVAPGGAGYMINPFSKRSMANYLTAFDEAFADYTGSPVRAQYHDSYEFRNNWSDELLEQFEAQRGYRLQQELPALFGKASAERVARVRSDYRQTVSDMMIERYITPWIHWAHRCGNVTRYQAHGSPANILDLYAAADIPEAEAFGTGWLEQSGVGLPPGIPRNWGAVPSVFFSMFAASAAHVEGKRLVACESCTWLSEHFQVSLAQVKANLDLLFTTGVNHVFYHGMAYSPKDALWPGWMFYATTNFAPSNTFYRDLSALNAYVTRCQSVLQSGKSDNDVLLYFPIYDLWAAEPEYGTHEMLHELGVTYMPFWFNKNLAMCSKAAQELWNRGYGFDFVSERQLARTIADGSRLKTPGASYQVLVLAGCSLMQPQTLRHIHNLVQAGGTVLIVGDFPADVPGQSDLEGRRKRFKQTIASFGVGNELQPGVREYKVGNGKIIRGLDVETLLRLANVDREKLVDHGVKLIRRIHKYGHDYFLTNPTQKSLDVWAPLAVKASGAMILDPQTEARGVAAVRHDSEGRIVVRLQLEPGESLILRALTEPVEGPKWRYLLQVQEAVTLTDPWQIEFIEGGPTLPQHLQMEKLQSWVDDAFLQSQKKNIADALRAFSGTAIYTLTFSKPNIEDDDWILDLGRVCESARVKLNGQALGTLYARPFQLRLGNVLCKGKNTLEIEVTNLMANRMIDLDRRNESWCPSYFIYMTRRPREWSPLSSGLLGPVRLIPMRVSHDTLIPHPNESTDYDSVDVDRRKVAWHSRED